MPEWAANEFSVHSELARYVRFVKIRRYSVVGAEFAAKFNSMYVTTMLQRSNTRVGDAPSSHDKCRC